MIPVLLLLLSSYTAGRALRIRFRIETPGRLEDAVVSTSLGLGLWCYLLFALGHLGLLNRWLLVGLAGFGALPAIGRVAAALRSRSIFRRPRMDALDSFLSVCAIIIVLVTLVCCFSPVTGGIKNDEVGGRLSVPRDWAREGRIVELSYPVSYMAGHGELLFLYAMGFAPQSGPKLVSWACMVMAAAAVFALLRRPAGSRAGALAALFFVLNPLVFRTSFLAFVDLPATLFAVMSVWALFRYRQTNQRRYFYLAALFLGIGCGAKATNYFYTAATVVFVGLVTWRRERRLRKGVGHAALFAVCVAVLGSPWPARNLILSGSPTFPPPLFLYELMPESTFRFSGEPCPRERAETYFTGIQARIVKHGLGVPNFFLLPWNITMDPESFSIGDSIGTILLGFVPLVLLLLPWPPWVGDALLYALLTSAAVYFLIIPEARYFMTAMAVLGTVAAWVYVRVATWKAAVIPAGTALVVNALFSAAVALRICGPEIKTVVSEEYRQERIRRTTPYIETFGFIDSLKPTRLVVPRGDAIYYHLQTPYIEDERVLRKPEQYRGAYYLDIDRSQRLERSLEERRGWYHLEEGHPAMELVYEGPDARVYRIR